ncbi:MAG TPA: hypothetical protein VFS43_18660 [Polyangiaceae bacterium]|nr:hypothetical protein [Polyangiaceae bacterium]
MIRHRTGGRLASLARPALALAGLGLGLSAGACSFWAQEDEGDRTSVVAAALSRTPWQMHDGFEPGQLIAFGCDPAPQHGNICEYDVATVPPAGDAGWGPAPNPDTIGFDIPSRVCGAPGGQTCFVYGDFTYFQTFVDIPATTAVTTFTIDFNGMDDGSRVTIYNSANPGGTVVPGSYVFLGGSGTANLAGLVVSGEVNRVVITQVDDCCSANRLHSAVVNLNGVFVPVCSTDADCDDGDACTDDVCDGGGTGCTHAPVTCDDGDACTRDFCDPLSGCHFDPQCPDCSNAGPSVAELWPPNHKFVPVSVAGVIDPQEQDVTIRIDSVRQDEPTNTVGDGNTCGDAGGVGTDTALLRAERTGNKHVPGDGRVYHVAFTATDPDGYACSGVATVCVPHDQGQGSECVDGGPLYDSLTCP